MNRSIALALAGTFGLCFVATAALAGSPTDGDICQIGVYITAGNNPDTFFLDQNDDGLFNGTPTDSRFKLAQSSGVQTPVSGDWNDDGIDDTGKYSVGNSKFFIDLNGDRAWTGAPNDRSTVFAASPGTGPPLIGAWNMGADEIAKYVEAGSNPDTFVLDLNSNGLFDGVPTDARFKLAQSAGVQTPPLVGDWNNDGVDDTGKFQASNNKFFIDLNGDRVWSGPPNDRSTQFATSAGTGVPLAGDWDGNGTEDIGIYITAGSNPDTFFLDLNNNGTFDGTPTDARFKLAQSAGVGTPLVCDWNGDGKDDLGKQNSANNKFFIDKNGDRAWSGAPDDRTTQFATSAGNGTPVLGVWVTP